MNQKLAAFIKNLDSLRTTISKSTINNSGFHAHGWNQVHLHKDHVDILIFNNIEKLKNYGDKPLTTNLENIIQLHTTTIEALHETVKSYFNDNASYLVHVVPNMLLTLTAIFSDFDYELFSYENIQEQKLLPKGLASRLRAISLRVDSLSESSIDLKSKISVINEAHEAAESLPTDLASLKEARDELTQLIAAANKELNDTKLELNALKEKTQSYKIEAERAFLQIEEFKLQSEHSKDEAAKLVAKCDEALQITTTQGLAAGFDQKAVELKNSLWVWIIGLLIALVSGAMIGAERVEAFTHVINQDLTAGQAILHTIMSIFSIGGPLWLAWISTQQINQRFKLSEDYFYKATVTKSFTGFKKFAEKFDTETEERLFNSTLDRLDEMPLRLISSKDYNSPWHEFVDSESFRNAMSMFPTLAQEAGKFANKVDLKLKPRPTTNKQDSINTERPASKSTENEAGD